MSDLVLMKPPRRSRTATAFLICMFRLGRMAKSKLFILHLFDIQLKEDAHAIPGEKSPRTGEHKKIIPGSVIPEPVDLGDIGRVGLEICYDIRFPDLHIILRRKGADVITLPSASTVPTGRAHWYTLVRAVAIKYQVYVIAATQAGAHSWGEALVFDPWLPGENAAKVASDTDSASASASPSPSPSPSEQKLDGARSRLLVLVLEPDDDGGTPCSFAIEKLGGARGDAGEDVHEKCPPPKCAGGSARGNAPLYLGHGSSSSSLYSFPFVPFAFVSVRL
ncbi:carbon-nitrogen hydrolase [Mycena galopus ATCC 62051]|nr:carbon-nitrogen hydrolase [Mycena galopus ATCC 62051]